MVAPINKSQTTALQLSLSSKGIEKVKVIDFSQMLKFPGIESLKRLPNLHQELTDLIKTKFGIEVTEIFCDREAKLEILGCSPSFIERVRNANGNLGVLGHTAVFEMESENSGKLYLLADSNKIAELERSNTPAKSSWVPPGTKITLFDHTLFKATRESVLETLNNKKKFAEIVPQDPKARLDFIFSSLQYWLDEFGEDPPQHIRDELMDLFIDTKKDPALVNMALDFLTRQMSFSSTNLLPLVSLNQYWVPRNNPSISIAARLIEDAISNDSAPKVVIAAGQAAMALDNILNPDEKFKIWRAAGLREPDCLTKSTNNDFNSNQWLESAQLLNTIKTGWRNKIFAAQPELFPTLLDNIEKQLRFLADSKEEHYDSKSKTSDTNDISQVASKLYANLQIIRLALTGDTLSSELNSLLLDLSTGLAQRDLFPRRYAQAGRELLDYLRGAIELAEKIKKGELEDLPAGLPAEGGQAG